jgi:hypothetical protein
LTRIRKNEPHPKGTQEIVEGSWQIDLNNGLPFLYILLHSAKLEKISMRIHFQVDAPTWIKCSQADIKIA